MDLKLKLRSAEIITLKKLRSRQLSDCVIDLSDLKETAQKCFVVEQRMIQISLLKIILSFGFIMQKQKIPVMNFARGAALEP